MSFCWSSNNNYETGINCWRISGLWRVKLTPMLLGLWCCYGHYGKIETIRFRIRQKNESGTDLYKCTTTIRRTDSSSTTHKSTWMINQQVLWERSRDGCWKCNDDASFHRSMNITSFGGCLRDSNGVFAPLWQLEWADVVYVRRRSICTLVGYVTFLSRFYHFLNAYTEKVYWRQL